MTVPAIDLREFQRFGYLAEANRQFFHPLGLALAVTFPSDGEEFDPYLSVLDDRADLEGWYMGNVDRDLIDKRDRVRDELASRSPHRMAALGYVHQPIPESEATPATKENP